MSGATRQRPNAPRSSAVEAFPFTPHGTGPARASEVPDGSRAPLHASLNLPAPARRHDPDASGPDCDVVHSARDDAPDAVNRTIPRHEEQEYELTILLDYEVSPQDGLDDRLTRLRSDIERWIDTHVEAIRNLGPTGTTRCILGGRHFAGYECFDCDFTGAAGGVHMVTVSACFANELTDRDGQVVDAVSALTLLGMLLDRVDIRPTVCPS
jgi:hypothetical protein